MVAARESSRSACRTTVYSPTLQCPVPPRSTGLYGHHRHVYTEGLGL